MSDTLQAIEYRRLVSSVAAQLSVEEVERITFIRLAKLDAVQGCNSDDTEEKSSALHTLAALERQGEFSIKNIDGLMEIVRDVNRHDLMRLIENYRKSRPLAKKTGKIKTPKLRHKHAGNSSIERCQLEKTYEMMVTRFTFLEQQMSLIPRLLEGEGDIQDEGAVVLLSLKCAAEELASNLNQAHKSFGQHLSESIDGTAASIRSVSFYNQGIGREQFSGI